MHKLIGFEFVVGRRVSVLLFSIEPRTGMYAVPV